MACAPSGLSSQPIPLARALTCRLGLPRLNARSAVLSLIPPLPPWLVLASLLGVINGAACFMLIGRDASRLAWYAVLGLLAASLGQAVASGVGAPQPLE